MSLNIGAGYHQRVAGAAEESCVTSSFEARRMLAHIVGNDPASVDAVALQEVDRFRSGRACQDPDGDGLPCGDHAMDFRSELNTLAGYEGCGHSFDSFHGSQDIGPTSCPDGSAGEYGNAVVVEAAIQAQANWRITEDCDPNEEQRGAAVTRIDFQGQPAWIVSTHLGWECHGTQVSALRAQLATLPPDELLVVAGDFNVRRAGRNGPDGGPYTVHAANLSEWNHLVSEFDSVGLRYINVPGNTASAVNPTKQIDFVFVRDPSGRVTGLSTSRIRPVFGVGTLGTGTYLTDHIGVEVVLHTTIPTHPAIGWLRSSEIDLLNSGIADTVLF
ncbi:MAG: endonuclease/exonuclease/phosphatase family protein [Sandaracinaceae bacterium]